MPPLYICAAKNKVGGGEMRKPDLVCFMLGFIFCLGMLDLVMTISHASTVGIYEVNPLARWVLNNWGYAGFSILKIAFTVIALTIFYRFRYNPWIFQIVSVVLLIYSILAAYLCWSNWGMLRILST